MNVTQKQKEMLLDIMSKNLDILRGRVSRNSQSRMELKNAWENIAQTLNCSGLGPEKSSSDWKKCWNDWKSNVLKKEAKKRAEMTRTGGGRAVVITFSDLEEKLLNLLTPEAAGMSNIPEGGLIFAASNTNVMINRGTIESEKIERNKSSALSCKDALSSQSSSSSVTDVEYTNIVERDNNNTRYSPIALSETDDDIHSENTLNIRTNLPTMIEKVKKVNVEKQTKFRNNDICFSPVILQSNTEADISKNTEDIENNPPKKIRKTMKVHTEEQKNSKQQETRSLTINETSMQMLKLQQQKLAIKNEELQLQKELIAVQKDILKEIKDLNENVRGNYLEQ